MLAGQRYTITNIVSSCVKRVAVRLQPPLHQRAGQTSMTEAVPSVPW
jgi:hypothetical protein